MIQRDTTKPSHTHIELPHNTHYIKHIDACTLYTSNKYIYTLLGSVVVNLLAKMITLCNRIAYSYSRMSLEFAYINRSSMYGRFWWEPTCIVDFHVFACVVRCITRNHVICWTTFLLPFSVGNRWLWFLVALILMAFYWIPLFGCLILSNCIHWILWGISSIILF